MWLDTCPMAWPGVDGLLPPLAAMQLAAVVIGGYMAQRFGPPPEGLRWVKGTARWLSSWLIHGVSLARQATSVSRFAGPGPGRAAMPPAPGRARGGALCSTR